MDTTDAHSIERRALSPQPINLFVLNLLLILSLKQFIFAVILLLSAVQIMMIPLVEVVIW